MQVLACNKGGTSISGMLSKQYWNWLPRKKSLISGGSWRHLLQCCFSSFLNGTSCAISLLYHGLYPCYTLVPWSLYMFLNSASILQASCAISSSSQLQKHVQQHPEVLVGCFEVWLVSAGGDGQATGNLWCQHPPSRHVLTNVEGREGDQGDMRVGWVIKDMSVVRVIKDMRVVRVIKVTYG
jgi:hypothetical protein